MLARAITAAAVAALAAGCAGEGKGSPPKAAAPHPVLVRVKPKPPINLKKPPPVDNSRCYVCHLNLEEEELVRTHAYGSVTCERCHGSSDDHCGAENHDIAPDIIFAKEKIPAACWQCHLAVKPGDDFRPANPADAKKGCLECHFQHRLANREREWDKATRRLIR